MKITTKYMRFIQGSFVGIGYIELFCRGCFDGAILTWAVLWAGYFDGAILTGLFCPGLFCRGAVTISVKEAVLALETLIVS
jgi:hypothetical protein